MKSRWGLLERIDTSEDRAEMEGNPKCWQIKIQVGLTLELRS
jgi:hypothetical protein